MIAEVLLPNGVAEAAGPNADGIYPEAFFRQRIEEEAHRAHRMHTIVTLVLIQGDAMSLAHTLRQSIRRMDVLGFYKKYLGLLLSEIPREEVSPAYAERVSLQSQGVMRIAGVVDTEWQEIYLGACLLPEEKSGKLMADQLLNNAEKALTESIQNHQPILYKGPRRFIDVPRKDVAPISIVRYGDLHVSRENHKAWIGSDIVEFLPKEYDLLLYLLKHQGKLVKREHLCKAVWGYEYHGSTRTVDMHIAKVRRKLKASRHITIRTYKGEGYRLDLTA